MTPGGKGFETGGPGEFKIEKGVPRPPVRAIPRNYINTLRKMKVDDSVVLPIKRHSLGQICLRAWGPDSYVSRSVKNGIRVWRIK